MTHPLTPREMVRKAVIDVMKPKDADITLGRIDTCTDAILTALASGSGDHAELARDLRAFEGSDDLGNGDLTVCEFAADALESLLAENAALRANEKAALKECSEWARKAGEAVGRLETSEAAGIVEGWKDRATEAERKLAKAVGLLRRIEGMCPATCETSLAHDMAHIASAWLSKEAERG